MSILTLIQDATREIGITTPETVVSTSDVETQQLLAHVYRTARELRDRVEWPKLVKTATITLVASQEAYALPADFDQQIYRTHWDNDNRWELLGPVSAQEWEWRKRGIIASSPRARFRLIGAGNNQFYVDPIPGTGEAGDDYTFEYISTQWILPRAWANNTTFNANTYCSYNANVYFTSAGGTTSGTNPTDDVGVTWTLYTEPYTQFLADTDYSLIDESLLNLGTQWRFLESKSLPYGSVKLDYENMITRSSARARGAKTLSAGGGDYTFLIGVRNVPDSGFGM